MKCKYCKKSAGFLSNKHKECKEKHKNALAYIDETIKNLFKNYEYKNYEYLKNNFDDKIKEGYISNEEFDNIMLKNINYTITTNINNNAILFFNFIEDLPNVLKTKILSDKNYSVFCYNYLNSYFSTLNSDFIIDKEHSTIIDRLKSVPELSKALYNCLSSFLLDKTTEFLSDNILDENEEKFLSNFIEQTSLHDYEEFNESQAYKKYIQALIIKDLQEGRDVVRLQIEGLPILLGKNEKVLWVYTSVDGYEEKTGKRYEGASQGVSIRIAKGVYYRTGASKGVPVEYQYNKELGVGLFVITNKNIYFLGNKQIKLGHNKIFSFEEYLDGICLIKEGVNPKPYKFVGVDAWFLINIIQLSKS